MGRKSKVKGATGEREAAKFWTDRGWPAARGRQYHGGTDAPDIKFLGESFIHVEVKRAEQLNIENALKQSEGDAGNDRIAVVMHRRNGEDWKITLRADTFIRLVTMIRGFNDDREATARKEALQGEAKE